MENENAMELNIDPAGDLNLAIPAPAQTMEECLFAQTPAGITIGVVTTAQPSSLTLLAAGVAGLAARRALRTAAINRPVGC